VPETSLEELQNQAMADALIKRKAVSSYTPIFVTDLETNYIL
jgi:hypothetical protein